jgi:MATE family multidrug resistance protein
MRTQLSPLSEIGPLIKAGVPLGLSYLASSLIVSTDILLIGWLGPTDMAGGSLAFVIYAVLTQIAIGFLYSVGASIARCLGAGRPDRVFAILIGATQILIVLYMVCAPLLYFSDFVLLHCGQRADAAGKAAQFLFWMILALPSTLGCLLLSEFLVAHGRGRAILWASVIGVVVNAALDLLLIFPSPVGPGWGIVGAAFSSIVTQLFMLFALSLASRNLLRNYWRRRSPVIDMKDTVRELLRVGIPLAALEVVLFSFFAQMTIIVGMMGTGALNAHGIFMQVTDVVMFLMFGFGEASAMRIAFLVGANDRTRQRYAILAHLKFALGYGILFGALVYLFRGAIVEFYTNGKTGYGEARELARSIAIGAGLLIAANPVQFMLVSILRAFSDTTYSLICSVICFASFGTGLGSALAFVLGVGPLGVWVGMVLAIVTLSICLMHRLSVRHLSAPR